MTGSRIVTVPGVRPVMQVAVTDTQTPLAVYDTSRYDTARYDDLDAGWYDDTCDVIDATTYYGRQRASDVFDVGTATIRVANPAGLWDYPPTTAQTPLTLRPGRQIRVGVKPADLPGYWTPGVPYVPGYLTATVGTATTPDPGPVPSQHVFVFRLQGPASDPGNIVVSQFEVAGHQSYVVTRNRGDAYFYISSSADGTTAAPLLYAPSTPVAAAAEYFAVGFDHTGGVVRSWSSPDGITWNVLGQHSFAPFTWYDSPDLVNIGNGGFTGRIYYVEHRTGLDPAAGTVLWRFDADDYPGGAVTGYTDPRGRVWTLTAAAAITPKVPAVPPVYVPALPADPVWLWHGWIDATEPGYDPQAGDVVMIAAVCAKGEAGRVEAARVEPAGPNETATARMTRLADLAAFPAHRRRFDTTSLMLAGSTLGLTVGQLMDMAAASSGGDVFGDAAGNLVYRGRDWQTRGPTTPVDGYIGNRGVPGEVCPNAWEVSFNRSDFTNRVIYSRKGDATSSIIDDGTNQVRYGIEVYKLSVETVDQTELDNLGARVMRNRNFDLAPRVGACTLNAARPGVAALLTAASPFKPSMYTCGHVTDDGRAVFTRNLYLTGIEHTIDANQWSAHLQLDDASPWIVPADTRYDTARYDTDRYTKVA